jgi:protein gp37
MKRSFLGKLKKYHGQVRLKKDDLETDLGSNNIIFVGSATDIFGKWVPDKTIKNILNQCIKHNNIYLFQTKNPNRFNEFLDLIPKNSILGTTLETNRDYPHISKAPKPSKRYQDFLSINHPRKMISIEPILDFDLKEFFSWIEKINPEFVSIGADSKYNNLPEPKPEKIEELISKIQELTEIRVKKNLNRVVKAFV